MWTIENRGRYDRNRLRYPSDLTDEDSNEAATAAGAAGFGEGFLPERMWMLKPIPQTGVTDGPVEPSSAPDD